MSEGFRRNFDAEIAGRARRDPRIAPPPPMRSANIPTLAGGVERVIVIPKTDRALALLLTKRCAIKPVGSDWHIEARDLAAFQDILAYLKLNNIHGVLKRHQPSTGRVFPETRTAGSVTRPT